MAFLFSSCIGGIDHVGLDPASGGDDGGSTTLSATTLPSFDPDRYDFAVLASQGLIADGNVAKAASLATGAAEDDTLTGCYKKRTMAHYKRILYIFSFRIALLRQAVQDLALNEDEPIGIQMGDERSVVVMGSDGVLKIDTMRTIGGESTRVMEATFADTGSAITGEAFLRFPAVDEEAFIEYSISKNLILSDDQHSTFHLYLNSDQFFGEMTFVANGENFSASEGRENDYATDGMLFGDSVTQQITLASKFNTKKNAETIAAKVVGSKALGKFGDDCSVSNADISMSLGPSDMCNFTIDDVQANDLAFAGSEDGYAPVYTPKPGSGGGGGGDDNAPQVDAPQKSSVNGEKIAGKMNFKEKNEDVEKKVDQFSNADGVSGGISLGAGLLPGLAAAIDSEGSESPQEIVTKLVALLATIRNDVCFDPTAGENEGEDAYDPALLHDALGLLAGDYERVLDGSSENYRDVAYYTVEQLVQGSVDASCRSSGIRSMTSLYGYSNTTAPSNETGQRMTAILDAPAETVSPGNTMNMVMTLSGTDASAVRVSARLGSARISGNSVVYTAPSRSSVQDVISILDGGGRVIGARTVAIESASTSPSVTVAPARASVAVGETRQFTATASGASGDDSVVWAVSNTTCGTIDSDGLFTSAGECEYVQVRALLASDRSVSGTATVRTTAAAAISVSVSPDSPILNVGDRQVFEVVVGGGATVVGTTWSSSVETVGPITASGVMTAIGLGETVITAVAVLSNGVTVRASTTAFVTVACCFLMHGSQSAPVPSIAADACEVDLTVLFHNNRTAAVSDETFNSIVQSSQLSDVSSIQISPMTAEVSYGGRYRFTVTVNGLDDTSYTCEARYGTIVSPCLYYAPVSGERDIVIATSTADPTLSARAVITLAP